MEIELPALARMSFKQRETTAAAVTESPCLTACLHVRTARALRFKEWRRRASKDGYKNQIKDRQSPQATAVRFAL